MSNLEYCCICEQPTGRAGKGNDSLYGDDDSGPYCEACWDEREKKEKMLHEIRAIESLRTACAGTGKEEE